MMIRHQTQPIVIHRYDPLLIGTTLDNRYTIMADLAHTAMAHIYLAWDSQIKQIVVMKRLSLATRPAGIERRMAIDYLRQEAHILQSLQHPSIPQYRDCFRIDDDYYVVMEHIMGIPLSLLISRDGLHPHDALILLVKLCHVVSYLHLRRDPIVHGDIKPSNIIITPTGKVTLLDFGIARHMAVQKWTRIPIGTWPYASPEQAAGAPLDPRSVERSTAISPHDRYANAQTLGHVLEAATSHQPVTTQTVRQGGEWLSKIGSALGILSLFLSITLSVATSVPSF